MVKSNDPSDNIERFVEDFNKNADGYFNNADGHYKIVNKYARALLNKTRILVRKDRELATTLLKKIASSANRGPNISAAIFLYSLDKDYAIKCGQEIAEQEDRIGAFAKSWLRNVETGWFRPTDF
jgi:hypothetical protein